MKKREQRVNKKIKALLNDEEFFITNISKSGGFLSTPSTIKSNFSLSVKIQSNKSISMTCMPKWSDDTGVGFCLLSIENEQELFHDYIDRQLNYMEKFGRERVFRTDIFITLENTNAMGQDVYFSNYFKFQGVCRERLLVHHVPNLGLLQKSGISLVTLNAYNKFVRHAYFGETITAELTTSDVLSRRATLLIKFKNQRNELLGEGYQTICCVNQGGRIVMMPDILDFLDYYNENKPVRIKEYKNVSAPKIA